MTDFDKQEFWNALGRLYDSTVNLRTAAEELRLTAESHERRLDYTEVSLEALRLEVKRLKELGAEGA